MTRLTALTNRRTEPMSMTVLPELAAESVETAERLGRLSAEEDLDSAEAEYILAYGLAALHLVPRLWSITKGRIGGGMTGPAAHEELAQLLKVVDTYLSLAGQWKERALVRTVLERAPEVAADLAAAERQLLEIRAEALHLLKVVDAPVRWPGEEQLRAAKERLRGGDRLTAEEFRHALLDQ
jgi:hypothetical protein